MANAPPTAETLNDQGAVLMSQGRIDEALVLWQQATQLKEIPETFNNLGYLHAYRNEWDQAIACYRRALELRPDYPEALSNLGIAHFQQKRHEEAIQCFQQALKLRPGYPEALNNLGNVWLAQGKSLEAGGCYGQVLRVQPNHADAYSNLGVVCANLKQWDKAVACWRHSLTLNPANPRTCRNLAGFYFEQNHHLEALRYYQQALALTPEDTEVQFLVDSLRGTAPPTRVPPNYVVNLFDSYADNFDLDLVDRLQYRGPQLLKEALSPAPPPRSLAILDLGCGTGLCGLQFHDWAHTLIGVDLSRPMLDRAHRRGIYDELLQHDLLTALQNGENKFDLVLAGDVLSYLGDLESVFQSAQRILRPGGRFAFTVELLDGTEDYRLRPTGRFVHSRSYLEQLAQKTEMHEVGMKQVILRTEGVDGVAALVAVYSRRSMTET